jgi:hypothetical protein
MTFFPNDGHQSDRRIATGPHLRLARLFGMSVPSRQDQAGKIEPNVTGPVLARCQRQRHLKAGIFERAPGGLYALEPSVRGYCERLRRIGPCEQGSEHG